MRGGEMPVAWPRKNVDENFRLSIRKIDYGERKVTSEIAWIEGLTKYHLLPAKACDQKIN